MNRNETVLTHLDHAAGSDQQGFLVQALNQCHEFIRGPDDCLIGTAPNGIITLWSPGATALFGYTDQEMLGNAIQILFPRECLDSEASLRREIINGAPLKRYETERMDQQGHRLSVLVSLSPIRDRCGAMTGIAEIVCVNGQIEEMAAAARIANAILQSTDDAVVSKSLDGVVTSWNPAASRLFGYSAQEMLGRSIEILLPEDRKFEEQFILERIRYGELVDHFETIRLRKDGASIDVSVTISPIRDGWGNIVGASKIARDITAQKRIESQLRLSASVYTATGEGILITDVAGRIIDVNNAFTRITGCGGQEVKGTIPQSLFRSDRQSPGVFRRMRSELVRTGSWQGKIWGRRKNGEDYAVLSRVSTVRDDSGEMRNFIGIFSETTSLKGDVSLPKKSRSGAADAQRDNKCRSLIAEQSRIRMAIQNQELVVCYQPKVNMRSAEVVGVEALVFWRHPERGLVQPDAFLPQPEEHDFSAQLDLWLLNTAVEQLKKWHESGLHIPVSINVDAGQILNGKFVAAIAAALARCPSIHPGNLEIEMSETSLVQDVDALQSILCECRGLGIKILIDHFGTGRSSLTLLKKLPVSTVKIDQSFVGNMLLAPGDLSVVKGIADLARAFNLNVIAEGVDTEAIGVELLATGCELGQGNAISAPMSSEAIPDWIENWRSPLAWIFPAAARSQSESAQYILSMGNIQMDLVSRAVFCGTEELLLSPKEFKLFEYMLRHPNQTVTRGMIRSYIWGYNFDPQTNLIDVHISKLRQKFSDKSAVRLRTVHNIGYVLTDVL